MAWLPCQIGPATPAWPTLRAALSSACDATNARSPDGRDVPSRQPRADFSGGSVALGATRLSDSLGIAVAYRSCRRQGVGYPEVPTAPAGGPAAWERPRSVKWPAPPFIVGKPSTKLAARPWRARLTGDLVPIGTRVGRPDGPIHGARRGSGKMLLRAARPRPPDADGRRTPRGVCASRRPRTRWRPATAPSRRVRGHRERCRRRGFVGSARSTPPTPPCRRMSRPWERTG